MQERGTEEQTCVDGAKTKSYLEGLAGDDIHRLVRVTALKHLVHKTAPDNPRSVTIVMDLGFRSSSGGEESRRQDPPSTLRIYFRPAYGGSNRWASRFRRLFLKLRLSRRSIPSTVK